MLATVEDVVLEAAPLVELVESVVVPLLAKPLVLPVCEEEALEVVDGDVLLVTEPEVCDDVSLLATVELLVELVAPETLPLLAKPLVLPVCEEALEVVDGDMLLVTEPEVCDDVSLLATVELLVELVEPEALPLLAKPLVLPVWDAAVLEVEEGDSLLLVAADVLGVLEVLSLLATLLLVDGVALAVVLLVEEGEVLLMAPDAEAEPLTFALILVFVLVFWVELFATFELLLEEGDIVDALVLSALDVEAALLLLVEGDVLPLLLVPYALEPVVPLALPVFCVLLL